jgi:ArsR family transcriptional regulator, lead/cadmium/zinc/bismuth-responsive transcriptional repressor
LLFVVDNGEYQLGMGRTESRVEAGEIGIKVGMVDPSEKKTDSENAEMCAVYLKALGDPVRLKVVRALRAGKLSVTDIALLLEIDMTNASHHLRVLYHADLVTTTREGKFIYYQLNGDFLPSRTSKKALDFGCCQLDLRQ